jgi:pimeloyl-ACP methyl ester carboxylesterase
MPPKDHAAVGESALKRLMADCAADLKCREQYPRLPADLQNAIRRLRNRTNVDPQIAMESLRSIMYSPDGLRRTPAIIDRLSRPDLSILRSKGQGLKYFLGVYLTITCSESFPWFNYAAAAAKARRTVFGDYRLRRQRAACSSWPRAHVSASHFARIRSNVPVLFISGERDAVSPPDWAAKVLRGFPKGRQIVLPWSGHVYDGLSNLDTCLDPMIISFLDSADVRQVDASCVANMRPPPFDTGSDGR